MVPAGIADDFVISTVEALKFAKFAQAFGSSPEAEVAKNNANSAFISNGDFM